MCIRDRGNPFYVGELLRTLEGERVLRQADRAWRLGNPAEAHVPPLLRQVIDARVDRLGEAARGLLVVAAVVGQEVPLDLWQAVSGTDEDTLLAVVETATEARLLTVTNDGRGVRFAHALIREALYEGTLPLRRRTWHRRTAEALLAMPDPDPDVVAHHFRQAGDARAVEWLGRAAERAFRASAHSSAVERLEAALPLLDAAGTVPGERAWFLFRLARLLRQFDPARGLAYLASAAPLATAAGEHALAAYITFDLGFVHAFVGVGGARQSMAGMAAGVAALDALPPEQCVVRGGRDNLWLADSVAANLAGSGEISDALDTAGMNIRLGTYALWLMIYGRYAEVIALGDRALAEASEYLPRNVFAQNTAADVWMGRGYAHASLGQPAMARVAYLQAAQRYRGLDHLWLEVSSLCHVVEKITMVFEVDDLDARAAEIAEIDRVVERGRTQTGGDFTMAPVYRIPLLYLAGQWAEALELVPPNIYFVAWAGVINRAKGERAAGWQAVRAALPDGPATEPGAGNFYQLEILQRVAAGLAIDAGDLPLARE